MTQPFWDKQIRPWALLAFTGTVLMVTLSSGFATETVRVPIKARGAGALFQICRGGKWGYMDRQGHVVVRPQFDDEHDFVGGLAAVREGAKWGYVNETGVAVIPYEFDDAGDFADNLAPVRSGRKWGFVDRLGHFKISPQFQFAARFSGGLARFEVWDTIQCDSLTQSRRSTRYTKDDAPAYAFRDHENIPLATGGCSRKGLGTATSISLARLSSSQSLTALVTSLRVWRLWRLGHQRNGGTLTNLAGP